MAVEQKLGGFRRLGHPKTRPQLWPSDQGAQDGHRGAASPSYSFTRCSWLLDNPCSLGSSFFPSWERGRICFSTVFSPGCPLKRQSCLMSTDLCQLEIIPVTQKAFFHAIQSMFVPCRNDHQGKYLSLGDINPISFHRSHKGSSQLFPTAALVAYPDLQPQVRRARSHAWDVCDVLFHPRKDSKPHLRPFVPQDTASRAISHTKRNRR